MSEKIDVHVANSIERRDKKPKVELEQRELPECDDLGIFINFLRGTQKYGEAFTKRKNEVYARVDHSGGERPGDEEVRMVFETSDDFKELLFDVAQYVVHIKFDPKKYSSEFSELFATYEEAAIQEIAHESTPELDAYGRERTRRHDAAAAQLAEDLVAAGILEKVISVDGEGWDRTGANCTITRAVIRAFLVDLGEDKWEAARTMDIVRRIRGVQNPEDALKEYYKQHNIPQGGYWYYDPGLVSEEQERFRTQAGRRIGVVRAKNYWQDKLSPGQELLSGGSTSTAGLTPRHEDAEHAYNPLKKRPFR